MAMNEVARAVGSFRSGHACSQAVVGTWARRFGLEENLALRISAGFGGGMGLAGTCGAVTGAVMVLGLAYCDDTCCTKAGRSDLYQTVRLFAEQFRQREGSLICRELLGCDITTEAGLKTAQDGNKFGTRCVGLVETAVSLLEVFVPPCAE